MFVGERRRLIVEMVRASGAVSLRDLAQALQTSEVTVRRDLRSLEADGLLDRRHGGAVVAGALNHEASYVQKTKLAAKEKAAIADHAVRMVADGDAIVVGVGSTTYELATRLTRFTDLTIVTNSLMVAQALAHAGGIESSSPAARCAVRRTLSWAPRPRRPWPGCAFAVRFCPEMD